jgi:hypothetical protein
MVEGSHIVENKLQLLEVMKFIININNLIKIYCVVATKPSLLLQQTNGCWYINWMKKSGGVTCDI